MWRARLHSTRQNKQTTNFAPLLLFFLFGTKFFQRLIFVFEHQTARFESRWPGAQVAEARAEAGELRTQQVRPARPSHQILLPRARLSPSSASGHAGWCFVPRARRPM